jgi:hypothetical protein
MPKYFFVTDCTARIHGHYGEAITAMTDRAKDIPYRTFAKMVGRDQLEALFPIYDWSRRPKTLTLKRDWHVRYSVSEWRGIPCAYLTHSAIEYIFTLEGEVPW